MWRFVRKEVGDRSDAAGDIGDGCSHRRRCRVSGAVRGRGFTVVRDESQLRLRRRSGRRIVTGRRVIIEERIMMVCSSAYRFNKYMRLNTGEGRRRECKETSATHPLIVESNAISSDDGTGCVLSAMKVWSNDGVVMTAMEQREKGRASTLGVDAKYPWVRMRRAVTRARR